jgi:hypothetical protein
MVLLVACFVLGSLFGPPYVAAWFSETSVDVRRSEQDGTFANSDVIEIVLPGTPVFLHAQFSAGETRA